MSLLHDSDLAIRLPAHHTSFVGREQELASILDALTQPAVRLVTLTGPGGVGKTRLAERVVGEMTAAPGLELIWISLAPLETAEQLAQAIGQQFGLKGIGAESLPDRLASTLLGRPVLMVLDNVEHLLSAAPMIAELLEACPTLTVLATSRGPLNLTWEHVTVIDPLPLPQEHASQLEIETNTAVRLFLERASFTPTEQPRSLQELQTVGAICRRLDGLPLAIELAAPWSRLLAADELLARLDRRLPLLLGGPADSPVRLQSMSSAIDWSYALLDNDARRLFRQLSIFPAAFTLEAAEFLAASVQRSSPGASSSGQASNESGILTSLASLVNQGVVRRSEQHSFHMLQTIREYGLGVLEDLGELEACGWAHLAWCLSRTVEPVFDALDGYLWGPPGRAEDQPDLAAALTFALNHEQYESALRLAITLSPLWAEQGRFTEARLVLERIRGGLSASAEDVRTIVLGWIAEWAWLQGDYSATSNLALASLEASMQLGLSHAIAANRYRLGRVATLTDPGAAVPLLLEALDGFRSLDDTRNSCWCLVGLGHAALGMGETTQAQGWFDEADANVGYVDSDSGGWLTLGITIGLARLRLHIGDTAGAGKLLSEALAVSRSERNSYFESLILSYLCEVYRRESSFARAVEAGRQGLQIAQLLGHRFRERQCLLQVASTALDAGKREQAILLDGGVAALSEQLDIETMDGSMIDRLADLAADDAMRLTELETAGRKLTGSELLAQVMALEIELKDANQRSRLLSNRERDVLRCLAQGDTNGEIADRLFVSRRTVDTHVGAILRKLQVASRHQAVETAREHGIVEPEAPNS